MQFFLKIKAWELFLLIVVVPFFITSIAEKFIHFANNISTLLFSALWLAWIWSVGINLCRKIENKTDSGSNFFQLAAKSNRFNYAAIYAASYMIFASFFFGALAPERMMVILPFHLMAMFSVFYMIYLNRYRFSRHS